MKNKMRMLAMLFVMMFTLMAVGCGKEDVEKEPETAKIKEDNNVLGEGKTQFDFSVVDKDGKETKMEIHTDKKTVGEALLELELIEGEESEYGLYVKKVNGITADYDVDKTYWAFYINDEYAMTGVDATEIKEGEKYTFKVEK